MSAAATSRTGASRYSKLVRVISATIVFPKHPVRGASHITSARAVFLNRPSHAVEVIRHHGPEIYDLDRYVVLLPYELRRFDRADNLRAIGNHRDVITFL